MTKRKKKQPFEAISMTDYSRAIHDRRKHQENKAARKNASPVTVYKPDGDGNMVAVQEVALPPPKRVSRSRNLKRIWSTL